MLTQPLLDKLSALGWTGFRAALEEQQRQPHYADLPFEDRRGLLVDGECTRRADARLRRRLQAARFALPATLEDLDLRRERGLDRAQVLELAQGEWVRHHLDLLGLGPTGAGKSYLACALGGAACRPAPLPEVARRLAVVHAELLLIHPFRDGNGRLARWLSGLMAVQAGYPAPRLEFAGRGSKKRREEYLAAVKRGYLEDYLPLARFFEAAILRREGERLARVEPVPDQAGGRLAVRAQLRPPLDGLGELLQIGLRVGAELDYNLHAHDHAPARPETTAAKQITSGRASRFRLKGMGRRRGPGPPATAAASIPGPRGIEKAAPMDGLVNGGAHTATVFGPEGPNHCQTMRPLTRRGQLAACPSLLAKDIKRPGVG